MASGFVKISRSIQEHWLYSSSKPFCKIAAWYDLIMFVYWRDSKSPIKGQMEVTKRGSRWTSSRELGDRWGWSRDKVERFLKLLESDGMITKKRTTNGTLVTIVNYSVFQDEPATKKPQKSHGQATVKPPSSTDEEYIRIYKESKEENNSFAPDYELTEEEIEQLRKEGYS